MGAFYVWGRGVSSSAIVRGGDPVESECNLEGDAWSVIVECDEGELDAQTRHDAATIGWRTAPKLV